MKKIILPVLILISVTVFSQEKRINIYGGYVFDDKFDSYIDAYNYYDGKIKGGFQYGVGYEYLAHPDFGIELLYIGQSTKAPTNSYTSSYTIEKTSEYDLNLNYAFLGLTKHYQSEKIDWYGGFLLGALFANVKSPETGESNSATKFSWGMRVGGNYWVSQTVGIKLQTQLLASVQSVGGELYFGSGSAGNATTSYSSMLQFGFSSGLVFRFSKKDE